MAAGKKEKRELLNHEQLKIVRWLKTVRFRRVIFGGVEERDVWKKIEELNTMYEAALSAERARYNALLRRDREAAGADESGCQKQEPENGSRMEDEKG